MSTLRVFFKDKWLEIAIIAIAFQLITNAVSIFLENRPLSLILAAIAMILFISLITAAVDVMKDKRREIGLGKALEIERKGIIFTIGLKSHLLNSPALKVIDKLKPQYCGFIGTKETSGSDIGRSLAEYGRLNEKFYREKVVEPTNVREIKEDTVHLIEWMLSQGLGSKDIVVDVTGGTAIMSVASYIAADERKIDTQYIYSEYRDNKPIEGTQQAILVSKYE